MKDEIIEISFVGDIAFFPKDFNESINSFDLSEYQSLSDSDLLIGNLEFPFSLEREPNSENSHLEYLAPLEAARILKEFKFDILCLANNHIIDWGIEGIITTKNVLNEIGIKVIGAGINDKEARQPVIIEKKGIKLGILNYCKKGPFSVSNKKPGASVINNDNIFEDIAKLNGKVNHIIILLHWGVEFSEYPYPDDVVLAHHLIDGGASCLIGHHPHVVQGLEVYRGKPIFYSLGSFIYNPYFERIFVDKKLKERLTSIAVKIKFGPDSISGWNITSFSNSGKTIFPLPIKDEERLLFKKNFDQISDRINNKKWFYNVASQNLLEREVKTVLKQIWHTKGLYIFKLFSAIKIRHLKILFGKFFINSK